MIIHVYLTSCISMSCNYVVCRRMICLYSFIPANKNRLLLKRNVKNNLHWAIFSFIITGRI